LSLKEKGKMIIGKQIIKKSIISGIVILGSAYFFVNIGFKFSSDDIKKCKENCSKWVSLHPKLFYLEKIEKGEVDPKLGSVTTINNTNYEGKFDIELPSGEFNVEFEDKGKFDILKIRKYQKKSTFIINDTLIWVRDKE
jgi:hypothetical protein